MPVDCDRYMVCETLWRKHHALQTWINTALGETFEEKGEQVEAIGLAARREQYGSQTIPAGALMLTVGTDVQDFQ